MNRISQNYPLIPKVAQDGIYGANTAEAVRVFQGVFNLPKTGVVDYATWYKISDVYVGVTRIAELRGSARSVQRIFVPPRSFDNYMILQFLNLIIWMIWCNKVMNWNISNHLFFL